MTQVQTSSVLSCSRAIQFPHRLPRAIVNALSPIEKLAVKALVQVGKLQIIDEDCPNRTW
jgi:hypothetical protein